MACIRDAQAMDAQQIEQQYGVSGAYSDTVATADGTLRGTLVRSPWRTAGGAALHSAKADARATRVYLRDDQGVARRRPPSLDHEADRRQSELWRLGHDGNGHLCDGEQRATLNCTFNGSTSSAPEPSFAWDWSYTVATTFSQVTTARCWRSPE